MGIHITFLLISLFIFNFLTFIPNINTNFLFCGGGGYHLQKKKKFLNFIELSVVLIKFCCHRLFPIYNCEYYEKIFKEDN